MSEYYTLILLFSVVVVMAVGIGLLISKKDMFSNLAGTPADYRLKKSVLNDSELALWVNLQKSLGDRFIVLSKVRIEDFVEVTERGLSYGERTSLRNKIKSRHVDFLVCDKSTTEPLLAIELDGVAHNNSKRIERDNFVDELYKSIGLPIKHIKSSGNFQEKISELQKILPMSNI